MGKLDSMVWAAAGLLAIAGCAPADSLGGDDGQSSDAPLSPAPEFHGDPANGATFAVDVSVWETPIAQAEMDCFWASGVRHVVVGTQQEDITREQLAMAVSRGMTVDAYVYLYWDTDVATQVATAFQRVSGFPIGKMWLDIEQDPGGIGQTKLDAFIQQAVTTCQASGIPCGIYTGPGFWKSYTGNTSAFTSIPLWYALYNGKTSLSDWKTEAFGGWSQPAAKQFATKPLCGIGGVDWDVMQVAQQPSVVVDRTSPPDTGLPPPAPGGLYPVDGQALPVDYAKVMSATIPRATLYQLAVERWTGSAWITYYTYSNPNAFVKFNPVTPNSYYRFRVRAQNTHGWGAWSSWSAFAYGKVSGSPPPGQQSPPPQNPPPQNPPPAQGVPGNLAPDGGSLVTTSNVNLSFSAVANATKYEVAIESQSGQTYVPYYTYSPSQAAVTFYPAIHGVGYRWRARALVNGTFGDWSSYATFQFK
jgi:hypothetical protein